MTGAWVIFGLNLLTYGHIWAYVGIVVFLMLTGAGLPIPEEVFIIAAGALSARGALETPLALAACLTGALAGDCVLYWIGHHFGRRVVREHHWWTRFVHPEREAQMERLIRDHGLKVLFLTRFLVGIRAPVYLSAGVLRVPFRRFFLYDMLCATTVIGTFFGLSYFLSDRYGDRIYESIHDVEIWFTVTVVVVLAATIIFFWVRHRRKLAATVADIPESEPLDRQSDQSRPRSGGDEPVGRNGDLDPVNAESDSRRL